MQSAGCSGFWFGFAPSVLAVGKEYLQNKDCHYMVYEAQSRIGADGLDFYDKYNEGEHELFDKYKSVNGATIRVYHIYPNDVELTPAMIENNE